MDKIDILFLTRKGEGCVGAPQTYHEFEQAVGKQANCMWAGEGWPLYKQGESMNATVRRVMPRADWVIADRDNTWVTPSKRWYKVGMFLSDLHGKHNMGVATPQGFVKLINDANFDAVFMKYMEVYGREAEPDIFLKELNCHIYHLPWSVDMGKHQWDKKNVDVAFMGSHHTYTYPLRRDMWNRMLNVCKGYNVIRVSTPTVGGTYGRRVSELKDRYYVGDRYLNLLNHCKILIFGSSIYRYPVQKYFEGSASGCLLLCDEPSTAKELGFIDGETYVKVGINNWVEKLTYCLKNYDSVKHIAEKGMNNTQEKHNHGKRAQQFVERLKHG